MGVMRWKTSGGDLHDAEDSQTLRDKVPSLLSCYFIQKNIFKNYSTVHTQDFIDIPKCWAQERHMYGPLKLAETFLRFGWGVTYISYEIADLIFAI